MARADSRVARFAMITIYATAVRARFKPAAAPKSGTWQHPHAHLTAVITHYHPASIMQLKHRHIGQ
jgi:hypothetical protein